METNENSSDPVCVLFNSVNQKFKANKALAAQQSSLPPSIRCIYKVPNELCKLNKSAYNPRVVSIGPIHSTTTAGNTTTAAAGNTTTAGNNDDDEHLKAMEHIKVTYTQNLIHRAVKQSEYLDQEERVRSLSDTLKYCAKAMHALATIAKNCYVNNVKPMIEEDRLAEIMLIDGCFILELLYRSYLVKIKEERFTSDDPVFGSPMTIWGIRHDLLLLENQIPFFVLKELFDHTVQRIPDGTHPRPSLTELVLSFFGDVMNSGNTITTRKKKEDYYHILHLLHTCYQPSPHDDAPPPKGNEDRIKFSYCASDLVRAGVKFRPRLVNDLFNVKFNEPHRLLRWCRSSTFEIPPMSIYDCTEPILRNLIAFEQCCPAVSRHFTSYAFLMDSLINSANDVELLEKAQIIHNYLGANEEASDLFNNLCKHAVLGPFHFAEQCKDAHSHCQHPWPRFLASFKRDYFGNPWSGIAVLAAFILFALTVVQTVYALLGYYRT